MRFAQKFCCAAPFSYFGSSHSLVSFPPVPCLADEWGSRRIKKAPLIISDFSVLTWCETVKLSVTILSTLRGA